ncbi:MAG: DNA translocase FtsK, partial [Clostridia bacterium]|nr:DNA translocase FtsK [Clostridia bacterium]
KSGAEIDGASAGFTDEDDDDLSAFFDDDTPKKKGTQNALDYADSIPIKIYRGSVSDALQEAITENASIINRTFADLKLTAIVTSVEIGPRVTTYRVHLNGTMRLNTIAKATEDLKFALGVNELRFLPPTGRDLTVSIEMLNDQQDIVLLEDIMKELRLRSTMGFETMKDTSVALGRAASGEPFHSEIASFPHMLISGATQTGKTTLLHSLIVGMITRVPKERLGLILVDLKGVEFDIYADEPHLQLPIVHDSKTAADILTELCNEMEHRYRTFMERGVRNIDQYNDMAKEGEELPRILFIVDDYADLIFNYRKEIETAIMRLSQKSRAAGIHVILSTQKADASTITGVLKSNIPTRLSFKLFTALESRDMISGTDAIELDSQGDALFAHLMNQTPVRISTPYISVEKIIGIVKRLIKTEGKAKYNQRISRGVSAYDIPEVKEKPVSYGKYSLPETGLLNDVITVDGGLIEKDTAEVGQTLLTVLKTVFNINAQAVKTVYGPRFTEHEILPTRRIGVARLKDMTDMLPMYLNGREVFIENGLGNEIHVFVENKHLSPVYMRELLEADEFKNAKSKTAVCLGKDVAGNPVITDIAKFPHALITGATGMGKSVCINAIITSILYKAKPDEVKLMLIDLKRVEFRAYENLPHLLLPVITDPRDAVGGLYWAIEEMERRYEFFEALGLRNHDEYIEYAKNKPDDADKLPKVVIVIDELNDLAMMAKDAVDELIISIAHKARSAGIHIIVGTQRPSTSIISGPLKASLPTRICFKVATNADSRMAIDRGGAEKLLNRGDMLFQTPTSLMAQRVQGAFISDAEVERLTDHIKGEVKRIEASARDTLLIDAIELAIAKGGVTSSLLQRIFSIGYNRATRLIEAMEELGVIEEYKGAKARGVLISSEEWKKLKGILENE